MHLVQLHPQAVFLCMYLFYWNPPFGLALVIPSFKFNNLQNISSHSTCCTCNYLILTLALCKQFCYCMYEKYYEKYYENLLQKEAFQTNTAEHISKLIQNCDQLGNHSKPLIQVIGRSKSITNQDFQCSCSVKEFFAWTKLLL